MMVAMTFLERETVLPIHCVPDFKKLVLIYIEMMIFRLELNSIHYTFTENFNWTTLFPLVAANSWLIFTDARVTENRKTCYWLGILASRRGCLPTRRLREIIHFALVYFGVQLFPFSCRKLGLLAAINLVRNSISLIRFIYLIGENSSDYFRIDLNFLKMKPKKLNAWPLCFFAWFRLIFATHSFFNDFLTKIGC